MLSRRMFLAMTLIAGCAGREAASSTAMTGRLQARPSAAPAGVRPSAPWLYVPRNLAKPAPLLVALHGAGMRGSDTLDYLRASADAIGAIVIAPDSHGRTWDVILDDFGPDVVRIDAELAQVFASFAIDPERIGVSGFSDGASYALTLGVANGDLFTHVIAFSPGFLSASSQVGTPRFFLSHGTHDDILPIDRCSRRLAPALQRAGYSVEYVEFDGGHTVPPEILRAAMDWFTE